MSTIAKSPAPWPPRPYITRIEAARLARASVQTIDKWVHSKLLTPLPKRGIRILFRTADIEHVIENGTPALSRPPEKVKKGKEVPR